MPEALQLFNRKLLIPSASSQSPLYFLLLCIFIFFTIPESSISKLCSILIWFIYIAIENSMCNTLKYFLEDFVFYDAYVCGTCMVLCVPHVWRSLWRANEALESPGWTLQPVISWPVGAGEVNSALCKSSQCAYLQGHVLISKNLSLINIYRGCFLCLSPLPLKGV